jgi:hypothetical protein
MQQRLTRTLSCPQLRELALAAAGSGTSLGSGAFGKVRALKGCTPPLCVKRVKDPSIATLKEVVLMADLTADDCGFVPKLEGVFIEGTACYIVMEAGDKTLEDFLTSKVRSSCPHCCAPTTSPSPLHQPPAPCCRGPDQPWPACDTAYFPEDQVVTCYYTCDTGQRPQPPAFCTAMLGSKGWGQGHLHTTGCQSRRYQAKQHPLLQDPTASSTKM